MSVQTLVQIRTADAIFSLLSFNQEQNKNKQAVYKQFFYKRLKSKFYKKINSTFKFNEPGMYK
jgi:hypothetical protein